MSTLPFAICLCLVPCLGAGLVMGIATMKACQAVARQPEAASKINSMLLLGLALTESTAIYGFATALIMMFMLA